VPKKLTQTSDLQPDPHNANQGSERGLYMVEHSLEQYGAGRSILADAEGRVIAGNKTLQAAVDMGLPVRVVETDGHELIVVQRTDLDLLSDDKRARMMAYSDNRSSQVGLVWSAEEIALDVDTGLDLGELFRADEIAEIMEAARIIDPKADPGPQIDRAAELQEQWGTERGQVWQVGRHKIMCGDSTSAEDVARLMGDAEPMLCVTDPPYGVEYDPAWRQKAAEDGLLAYAARRVGEVQNDDRVDWAQAISLFAGSVLYCWHDALSASGTQQMIEASGFELRSQIVWAKRHFPISRGHYHWRHEVCWYAFRKGAQVHWIGDHKQTTVWDDITLDKNAEGGHSTQKPVECMARPIRNHEGAVYDPFLGSGTTIVACEQLGRIGYGMEISEKYVAVTLQRLADMGLEPMLTDD